MNGDCAKARVEVYLLEPPRTATTMHLFRAVADAGPDVLARADAVYSVRELPGAAGLLRTVAAGHGAGEIVIVCAEAVIAAVSEAARRCRARCVVLPALVSSTVVRVGSGRDDFWQELSDVEAGAESAAARAAAALLAEV
jgi:hypothetical protein